MMLGMTRQQVSGNPSSSQVQFADELHHTSKDRRESILKVAGFDASQEMSPEAALALKADLQLPWNKLRHLRRYYIYIYIHCMPFCMHMTLHALTLYLCV